MQNTELRFDTPEDGVIFVRNARYKNRSRVVLGQVRNGYDHRLRLTRGGIRKLMASLDAYLTLTTTSEDF